MFFKRNMPRILLFLIIILALFLRTYHLSDIPSGFFADEASIGYNAYSILTKGVDEYGTPYPLFFQAFGEFKSPIEIYSTVPFILTLGLNEFSIRFPSVIFGTLTVILIYFLTKELVFKCKSRKIIALIAALFLAISPWHIHFSRAPMEGFMPYILFAIMGTYFFLKSQTRIMMLYPSIVFFVLATYCYFPARIFIPLFGLGILIFYHRFFWHYKKEAILSLILTMLLLAPLLAHSISPVGFSRWQQVSIFYNPSNGQTIFQHIFNNYTSHFSLEFLFTKGDSQMPGQFITRHSVQGIGELYQFQLPFIIFGFIFLIKRKIWKTLMILSLWLILYPTGSMFTVDQNAQATRSISGVVPFQILSAIGLFYLFSLLSKLKNILNFVLKFCFLIVIFIYFISYLNLYFVQYALYSSNFWGWQYGARDIVKYFVTNEQKYDQMIMAPEFNSPEIFFKFYAPNDCHKCVIGAPSTNSHTSLRQLFAVTPNYLQNNPHLRFNVLKTIYYPNRSIAFEIGEVVQ
jgi:4-amino-4-deoxy-L-arabinose transferase-like glycosyltransferase